MCDVCFGFNYLLMIKQMLGDVAIIKYKIIG